MLAAMVDPGSESRSRPLAGRRVLLAVTGGIAAYKAAELARLLIKADAQVRCVMTRGAREFLQPLTLQALTGQPVGTELFDLDQESEIGHIKLAEWPELLIVAPATADAIARLAHGLADDLLTTIALVTRAPMLLAPAMNVHMWSHELTQANVKTLVGLGRVHVVGPGDGFLACRTTGPGRLAEPADIVEAAGRVLTRQDLAGRRVLVTAGPTHEAIDGVRFIANRSSGKMGVALARAAATRGALVTLVLGPSSVEVPPGIEVVRVTSAVELEQATTTRAAAQDLLVMAAAVADFRPAEAIAGKRKKEAFGESPVVALVKNPDVLAQLGKARQGRRPVLVGFAAETDDLVGHARRKLRDKGCDLIVANDVGAADAGFEVDDNRVTLIGPGDEVESLPLMAKAEVAHRVLDAAARLLGEARP
jgi:phosphopantothenoylcysteine decarboxylase/phosphopantothenate--cysteine ligase